jgi:hypothetical protein
MKFCEIGAAGSDEVRTIFFNWSLIQRSRETPSKSGDESIKVTPTKASETPASAPCATV